MRSVWVASLTIRCKLGPRPLSRPEFFSMDFGWYHMLDMTDSNCFLTTFLKFESFFTNQEQQLNKSVNKSLTVFAGIFQNVSFPAKFYALLFPAPSEFISLKDFCEETSLLFHTGYVFCFYYRKLLNTVS